MRRGLLLVAALMLLPARPAAAQEEEKTGIASLPRRCGICHLERVESAAGAFNFLSLKTVEGAGEEGLCYSCHNGIVMDSRRSTWAGRQHRAGGRDATAAPGRTPSCGTCHDPHVQETGVSTFMRYREGYFKHCVTCHGRTATAGHPAAAVRDGILPDCGSCHRVHRAAGERLFVKTSLGDLCSSCHGDNPSRRGTGAGQETHPSGTGAPDCDSCHSVHKRSEGKLVRPGVINSLLCRECHKDHAATGKSPTSHPVTPGGAQCLTCHSAHNGARLDGRSALLAVKPAGLDDLCQSCHGDQAAGSQGWNHPVGRPLESPDEDKIAKLKKYGGHLNPAGEVQCISCHKSHRAFPGTAGLVVKSQALCLYCHAAQNSLAPKTARFGTHPVSVRPKEAIVSPRLVKAGGEIGQGGELICTTCHRTHGGGEGTSSLVLPPSEYSCTICHTAEAGVGDTPHGSAAGADPCLECHGHHGWAIPLEESQMGGSAVEKVCWHCHGPGGSAPMSGYFGHIVGVPPSSKIRDRDLPLFWSDGRRLENGLITCATCHDAHRNPAGNFLRITAEETQSNICLGCHRSMEAVTGTKHDIARFFPGESNRRGESAARTGPCGACHLVHSGGPGESWARDVKVLPGEPGELAAFCADCHQQGSFAQGKVVGEKSHPPLEVLEQRPDTPVVECGGCHNPHVWNPLDRKDKGDFFVDGNGSNSFLVKPADRDSRLCLGCHEEKKAVAGSKHDVRGGDDENGGVCMECHLPHGGESLFMWSAPLESTGDYGTGTCLSCHGSGGTAPSDVLEGPGHPVGVNPGPDTGQDLPRYSESGRKLYRGSVACATCHDPHVWSPLGKGAPATAGPATSFLRLPADGFSPLCFPCHANRSLVVGTDHDLRVTAPESVNLDGETPDESGVCGACHKVHGAPVKFALWNRAAGRGMDPQSTYCRSCHEEGAMEEASVPARIENHLVDYPGKGLVGRPFQRRQTSFAAISASGFEIFNEKGEKESHGFISCATCHDAHRWEPDTTRSGTGIPLDGDLKNSFLKVRNTFAVGKAFCRECHAEDTLEHFQLYHEPDYRGSNE